LPKIGIGVIGLGRVASWGHFPAYLQMEDKVKIAALCDSNSVALEEKARLCTARTYTNYEDLLNDPDVDAVDICLPHHLHGKIGLAALNSGKHLLIEKPFTATLAEAESLIDSARKKNLKIMVAENTRFINAYEITRKFLDEEGIGKINVVRTLLAGNSPAMSYTTNWRTNVSESGGGAIFDAAVHSFYLLEWMAGRINSMNVTIDEAGHATGMDGSACGILNFNSGTIGHFTVTVTSEIPWTERLELFGSKGTIIVDMLSERPVQVFWRKESSDRSDMQNEQGLGDREAYWREPFFPHSATAWKAASVRKEVYHFVECILENKTPLVSGEDGKRGLSLVLAAYESARTGKEVKV